jgi:uncharacterized damage-inducible protein DinB
MPLSELIELLYGQGAHANTLGCIEDVSFELAGHRAPGFSHSIWQQVCHMNFWMAYELKRIRGEAPVYPAHASESWPADPAPLTPTDWNETVARFRNNLAKLAMLADSPPDVLAREVSAMHPAHTKLSSSLLAVLWQTVVHNSYHIGQVAALRRAVGAWPPKSGGDSW